MFLNEEGKKSIEKMGHRNYIGGKWDELGNLQFNFLKSKGLTPESYLLDIACGSLRLGVKAIPYLNRSHYLGIEKESELVKAGLDLELDKEIVDLKKPKIIISEKFEIYKFKQKVDFAIAQSLFSHLPPDLIELCFENLSPWLNDDGVFFATFFEEKKPIDNPKMGHSLEYFGYTKNKICSFGKKHGFKSTYIGDWNHPRCQIIVEYRKKLV